MGNVIDISTRRRQPRGVRTGGQFATERRGEATVVVLPFRAKDWNGHVPDSPAAAQDEAPDAGMHPGLDAVVYTGAYSPTLARAEHLPLPGYVDKGVRDAVAEGLRAAAGMSPYLDHRNAVHRMQEMANCLPSLGRADIEDAVAGHDLNDPSFGGTARDLVLRDQLQRGLAHGYTPSGTVTHDPDARQFGYHTVGSRASDATTGEKAREVAREIKAAVKGGYLPAGLQYRHKTENYSGGSSITVTIEGLDAETIYNEGPDGGGFTGPALELHDRVQGIMSIFNRNASDSMNDYYRTDFSQFVAFRPRP